MDVFQNTESNRTCQFGIKKHDHQTISCSYEVLEFWGDVNGSADIRLRIISSCLHQFLWITTERTVEQVFESFSSEFQRRGQCADDLSPGRIVRIPVFVRKDQKTEGAFERFGCVFLSDEKSGRREKGVDHFGGYRVGRTGFKQQQIGVVGFDNTRAGCGSGSDHSTDAVADLGLVSVQFTQ